MRRRTRDPARRLRLAVERLPQHTKQAMLRGIESNRIVVGAYVDPRSGGVCPMLAAHRNGGRSSVSSFARAWDEYTGARRARRATRREVRTLRSLLEASLDLDPLLEHASIAELAAQIRAERAQRARCAPPADQPAQPDLEPSKPVPLEPPAPAASPIRIRRQPVSDVLAATERELFEGPAAEQPAPRRDAAEQSADA